MRNKFDNGPPWYSSYEKNNYGELFYALMRIYKPLKVVELGTKAGYSAYHIARGLKANRRGRLYCYDLWKKYQFRSNPKSTAEKNLEKFRDIISFNQQDAVGVDKLHNTTDILHIDLSNKGELLEKIVPNWIDKVGQLLIIEGGSPQRDRLDWMIKFKHMPIRKWLEDFAGHRDDIEFFTIEPFLSVTLIRKK